MKDRKSELIDTIVDIELHMFEDAPNARTCQCHIDEPDAFKFNRKCAFEFWSTTTLSSYLQDLYEAIEEQRNLLDDKYGRINGTLGYVSLNPLIDKIVEIQSAWQEEIYAKYPHVIGPSAELRGGLSNVSYKHYLRCELETYSDNTLDLYYQDILKAKEKGRNIAEDTYTRLIQGSGLSLEQMEKHWKEIDSLLIDHTE